MEETKKPTRLKVLHLPPRYVDVINMPWKELRRLVRERYRDLLGWRSSEIHTRRCRRSSSLSVLSEIVCKFYGP